jgi:hypothetical protein
MRFYAMVLAACVSSFAHAQNIPAPQPAEAAPESDSIFIIASADPVIAAVRADALSHRGKLVPQICTATVQTKDMRRVSKRQYYVEGENAFQWQLLDLQIDGEPASEKEFKKFRKQVDRLNEKPAEGEDDDYSIFADLIADKDRIERLPEIDGMRRYRINRLPKSISKDLPGAIAERLKPILWIADVEGEPFVQRMEVRLADFRMYLVAKIKRAEFDIYFERRPDGFVKERKADFDAEFSFFGRDRFNKGSIECDAGGAVVMRPVLAK